MIKNLTYYTLTLFFCGLLFLQCESDVEGCLDPLAGNFEVNADEACASCCTYPDIILRLIHNADTNFYNETDTLLNDLGVPYIMRDTRFFISNVQLQWEDGSWTEIEDTILIRDLVGTDSFYAKDNFVLVRRTQTNPTIGSNRGSGRITHLRFGSGLPDSIATSDPSVFSGNHALNISSDSTMYDVNSMRYLQFSTCVTSGVNLTETTKYQIGVDFLPGEILLAKDTTFIRGANKSVGVIIDHQKWLDGLSDLSDSVMVRQALINNFPNVFSAE